MAFRPQAVVLDENLPILRGRRVEGFKVDAPLKPAKYGGLQERKALRDVSNTGKAGVLRDVSNTTGKAGALKDISNIGKAGALKDISNIVKPPVSSVKKGSALKGNSLLRSHETVTVNKAPKSSFLSDEEIRKCQEWAKEGVEHAHFTGNDAQKLKEEQKDKRVKKKVEKIMSALHGWSDVIYYDPLFQVKEVTRDTEEVKKMELEPEILLPDIYSLPPISGDVHVDHVFTEPELDEIPFVETPLDFQLKDELLLEFEQASP